MIHVRPDHLDLVRAILNRHVPEAEIRAFGSRVADGADDRSDLDLAIVGSGRVPERTLALICADFEDSDLPFRVDVLDWEGISPEFRSVIGERFEILKRDNR
ncbi:MAG: nucleotidyltransferase domain-containing protein [Nitrospirae bacterium]|nr:nucleotidyltransferase domain-containing protein [Nitrospirota bacterium]